MCIQPCMQLYICSYLNIYIYIYAHAHACIHIIKYVYMHIYIYIYIFSTIVLVHIFGPPVNIHGYPSARNTQEASTLPVSWLAFEERYGTCPALLD